MIRMLGIMESGAAADLRESCEHEWAKMITIHGLMCIGIHHIAW